jgi:hypothetical protein
MLLCCVCVCPLLSACLLGTYCLPSFSSLIHAMKALGSNDAPSADTLAETCVPCLRRFWLALSVMADRSTVLAFRAIFLVCMRDTSADGANVWCIREVTAVNAMTDETARLTRVCSTRCFQRYLTASVAIALADSNSTAAAVARTTLSALDGMCVRNGAGAFCLNKFTDTLPRLGTEAVAAGCVVGTARAQAACPAACKSWVSTNIVDGMQCCWAEYMRLRTRYGDGDDDDGVSSAQINTFIASTCGLVPPTLCPRRTDSLFPHPISRPLHACVLRCSSHRVPLRPRRPPSHARFECFACCSFRRYSCSHFLSYVSVSCVCSALCSVLRVMCYVLCAVSIARGLRVLLRLANIRAAWIAVAANRLAFLRWLRADIAAALGVPEDNVSGDAGAQGTVQGFPDYGTAPLAFRTMADGGSGSGTDASVSVTFESGNAGTYTNSMNGALADGSLDLTNVNLNTPTDAKTDATTDAAVDSSASSAQESPAVRAAPALAAVLVAAAAVLIGILF